MEEKILLFPVLLGSGNVGNEFTVRTRAYGEEPILEITRVIKIENRGIDGKVG